MHRRWADDVIGAVVAVSLAAVAVAWLARWLLGLVGLMAPLG
jgi:hypothetical protein